MPRKSVKKVTCQIDFFDQHGKALTKHSLNLFNKDGALIPFFQESIPLFLPPHSIQTAQQVKKGTTISMRSISMLHEATKTSFLTEVSVEVNMQVDASSHLVRQARFPLCDQIFVRLSQSDSINILPGRTRQRPNSCPPS